MAPEPPLIVIAAGGDGSRIGGDKPARLLAGERLIDRTCAWARQHSDAVALAVRPGNGDWGTGLPLSTIWPLTTAMRSPGKATTRLIRSSFRSRGTTMTMSPYSGVRPSTRQSPRGSRWNEVDDQFQP